MTEHTSPTSHDTAEPAGSASHGFESPEGLRASGVSGSVGGLWRLVGRVGGGSERDANASCEARRYLEPAVFSGVAGGIVASGGVDSRGRAAGRAKRWLAGLSFRDGPHLVIRVVKSLCGPILVP